MHSSGLHKKKLNGRALDKYAEAYYRDYQVLPCPLCPTLTDSTPSLAWIIARVLAYGFYLVIVTGFVFVILKGA